MYFRSWPMSLQSLTLR